MNEKVSVKSKDSITTVEDANLVAFLIMRGYVVIPYIKSHKEGMERRVAWDVQGDADRDIKRYFANEKVPIKDFIRSLKEVRNDMYNIKSIGNNNSNNEKEK